MEFCQLMKDRERELDDCSNTDLIVKRGEGEMDSSSQIDSHVYVYRQRRAERGGTYGRTYSHLPRLRDRERVCTRKRSVWGCAPP